MRRFITLLCLLLGVPTIPCPAQSDRPASEARVQTFVSFDRLVPGSRFRAAIVVEIAERWHINANPVTIDGLIPTTVTFDPPASIVIERIVYPKGKNITVSWADEPVALYTGRETIFAEGRVLDDTPPGPLKIDGTLRYQACDDSVCLAPAAVPVLIETEIADRTYKPQPVHSEIFALGDMTPLSAAPTQTQSANRIEQLIQERGWLIAFAVVFLGGLALNLTPCVYPMIAITVSYFGGQSERKMTGAFAHALTYFLGIVLTYSALGLAAALTGGLFGALLQSRAVLIGVAVLLVALALSMIGCYEIRPPQFLMQKATGLSSKAGYVGVFFLGAMVGIIAAPCIAPILVALLAYVGQRADPWLGWWVFFTLAAGLGIPYVLLGTFSGLLTRLPKSGTWMVWVKRVFGLALIAVAVWITNPLWPRTTTSGGGIAWQPYAPAKLQQALTDRQPVIIDFYADWCIPCKEMDKKTFADPRVIEKSKRFVTLKADLTRVGSPEVEQLTKHFKIFGVPTTVFISPNGQERADLRQVGFVPPNEFLSVMDRALGASPH